MMKLPKNEGLNIIPFIDIMLVLLAIILSISTFIAHGEIKIDLPQSQSANTMKENKDKITINIDKNNDFFIDNKKIQIKELEQIIILSKKTTLIELKSDKEAKFESFVQIIDILKNSQHENFQIITEKKR